MKITIETPKRPIIGPYRLIWRVYPITYKEKRYVVELRAHVFVGREKTIYGMIEETKISCDIYEYNATKKILRGHRGRRVWYGDVTKLQIDEGRELFLPRTTKDEFVLYLPQIIKAVFEKYETSQNMKLRVQEAEKWDGVVGR